MRSRYFIDNGGGPSWHLAIVLMLVAIGLLSVLLLVI